MKKKQNNWYFLLYTIYVILKFTTQFWSTIDILCNSKWTLFKAFLFFPCFNHRHMIVVINTNVTFIKITVIVYIIRCYMSMITPLNNTYVYVHAEG